MTDRTAQGRACLLAVAVSVLAGHAHAEVVATAVDEHSAAARAGVEISDRIVA